MANTNDMDFDKRVVERYIAEGKVSQEEYDRHLSQLKDAAENSTPWEAELRQLDRELPASQDSDEDEL